MALESLGTERMIGGFWIQRAIQGFLFNCRIRQGPALRFALEPFGEFFLRTLFPLLFLLSLFKRLWTTTGHDSSSIEKLPTLRSLKDQSFGSHCAARYSKRPKRPYYQRWPRPRLPPPPPPPPRLAPNPPPPPPVGLGRASFTFMARPYNSAPFSCDIAVCAACGSDISTKAKPRGWPLSRSVTRLTRSTLPYASKAA